MKAICWIDFCYCFVTTNNKLYVFYLKEYEKSNLNLKRANKGEKQKNWLMDANPYIWIFI